jgi:hypothetical protein
MPWVSLDHEKWARSSFQASSTDQMSPEVDSGRVTGGPTHRAHREQIGRNGGLLNRCFYSQFAWHLEVCPH